MAREHVAMIALAAWASVAHAQTLGHPTPGVTYPEREGFTLWLVEEFEEPLDLDTDPVWTWSDGALPEGEVRFVKEGVKFENGRMMLEVNRAEPGTQRETCSHAESTRVGFRPLTSGEMRSRHNLFRYGYYEARMKAPEIQPNDPLVNGNYISTMFVYHDAKFRHWREIDVELTGDSPSALTVNVLHAENTSFWRPDIEAHQSCTAEGLNLRADFHTYGFEWLPTGITWYLDGKEIAHHGPEHPVKIPELSGKIIMNLWVFNSGIGFGGMEGVNNRYPFRSEYEWFRFYRWNSEDHYPCAGLSTDCLTEEDRFLSGNNPCDGIPLLGDAPGVAKCEATCHCEQPESPALAVSSREAVSGAEAPVSADADTTAAATPTAAAPLPAASHPENPAPSAAATLAGSGAGRGSLRGVGGDRR